MSDSSRVGPPDFPLRGPRKSAFRSQRVFPSGLFSGRNGALALSPSSTHVTHWYCRTVVVCWLVGHGIGLCCALFLPSLRCFAKRCGSWPLLFNTPPRVDLRRSAAAAPILSLRFRSKRGKVLQTHTRSSLAYHRFTRKKEFSLSSRRSHCCLV